MHSLRHLDWAFLWTCSSRRFGQAAATHSLTISSMSAAIAGSFKETGRCRLWLQGLARSKGQNVKVWQNDS